MPLYIGSLTSFVRLSFRTTIYAKSTLAVFSELPNILTCFKNSVKHVKFVLVLTSVSYYY